MRRRDFITLLGGAAAAWPRGARALGGRAPGVDPVIGFLGLGTAAQNAASVAQLRYGLQHAGYIDAEMARQLTARNKRYAEINVDRIPLGKLSRFAPATACRRSGQP
jgi:putative ABC transport system substrate-binding protein